MNKEPLVEQIKEFMRGNQKNVGSDFEALMSKFIGKKDLDDEKDNLKNQLFELKFQINNLENEKKTL